MHHQVTAAGGKGEQFRQPLSGISPKHLALAQGALPAVAVAELAQGLDRLRRPLALEFCVGQGQLQRLAIQFDAPPLQLQSERRAALQQGGRIAAGADAQIERHHLAALG